MGRRGGRGAVGRAAAGGVPPGMRHARRLVAPPRRGAAGDAGRGARLARRGDDRPAAAAPVREPARRPVVPGRGDDGVAARAGRPGRGGRRPRPRRAARRPVRRRADHRARRHRAARDAHAVGRPGVARARLPVPARADGRGASRSRCAPRHDVATAHRRPPRAGRVRLASLLPPPGRAEARVDAPAAPARRDRARRASASDAHAASPAARRGTAARTRARRPLRGGARPPLRARGRGPRDRAHLGCRLPLRAGVRAAWRPVRVRGADDGHGRRAADGRGAGRRARDALHRDVHGGGR